MVESDPTSGVCQGGGGFQEFQETPTEIVSSKKSSGQCVACWQTQYQYEYINLHHYSNDLWGHSLPPQNTIKDRDTLIEQSVKCSNRTVTTCNNSTVA